MGLKGVIFDMDDVVYLESEYIRSGFRAVARSFGAEMEESVFDILWGMAGQGGEQDVFQQLLRQRPELEGNAEDLEHLYRTHTPDIQMLPEARKLVRLLQGKKVPCGLVSDGDTDVQERKLQALGAEALFDSVLLTQRLSDEPWKVSSLALDITAHDMDLLNESLVYVGDKPVKDFIGAQKLSWKTILLEQPGQRDNASGQVLTAPHHTVGSFCELQELLETMITGTE